ncbi:MAG: UDP-glucose 6-dehydrogenase, partial [Pseudonocardia sp.]|nr:UDP-glucose 6-dehydrogenase [Pseudonocardia sp.]
RIGLLGLTFKAGTDDLRDSPALAVAALLRREGADLVGYDPAHPVGVPGVTDAVTVVDDPIDVAKDASVLVVLTDWPQFRALDWHALGGVVENPVVVDARNLLDGDVLRRAGFTWIGLGRP